MTKLDIKLKYIELRQKAKYKYNWDLHFMNLTAYLFAREKKEIQLHVKKLVA